MSALAEMKDDLLTFVQHCEVRDKDGEKTAFELSPVQRRLLDVLEKTGAAPIMMKVRWRWPRSIYRFARRGVRTDG